MRSRISSFICAELRTPIELLGSLPLGRKSSVASGVVWMTSSKVFCLSRKFVSPIEFETFRILWMLGRRKSESTTNTLEPFWANTVAKLKMVVDLPSPAPPLTTVMVLSLGSLREKRMFVRNTR